MIKTNLERSLCLQVAAVPLQVNKFFSFNGEELVYAYQLIQFNTSQFSAAVQQHFSQARPQILFTPSVLMQSIFYLADILMLSFTNFCHYANSVILMMGLNWLANQFPQQGTRNIRTERGRETETETETEYRSIDLKIEYAGDTSQAMKFNHNLP
jgi:hypothetical protein